MTGLLIGFLVFLVLAQGYLQMVTRFKLDALERELADLRAEAAPWTTR